MKKEQMIEIGSKLGLNINALENMIKDDSKAAEKMVTDAAKFMKIK